MKRFFFTFFTLIISIGAIFFSWTGAARGQAGSVTYHPAAPVAALPAMLSNVLNVTLGALGVVALLAFIWGGFVWMTSGGDPGKITKARKTMIWAVAGLAIIFASYSILALVFNAFGYPSPGATAG
jgi:Type IV secretion system pilin